MDVEEQASTPDLLTAARQRWRLCLAVVGVFSLLGAGAAGLLTPSATATGSLVVSDPRSATLFGSGVTDGNYVANQVALLKLRGTAERAVRLLPAGAAVAVTAADLVEDVKVASEDQSGLITISYTSRSPEQARAVVNSVLDAYREILQANNDRSREETIAGIDAALASLQRQATGPGRQESVTLAAARDELLRRRAEVVASAQSATGIVVADPARTPVPSAPVSRWTGALFAGLLGLVPAAALAYVLALGRPRFAGRFEPEAVLGERLLSDIPVFSAERLPSDVPALDAQDSAATEAFRFAATLLAIRQGDLASRTHAVVSASSQDGKSTVCANLAVTAALAGRRVLAIDGDLDGRGLSFLLLPRGEQSPRGLLDVLDRSVALDEAIVHVPMPGGHTLDLLPGGGDGAGGGDDRISGSAWAAVLAAASDAYDVVLLDVPPLLQVAYSSTLARAVDAALVVVPHDSLPADLHDLTERLEFLGLPTVGYVYNKAPLREELGQHSKLVTDARRRPGARTTAPVEPGAALPSPPAGSHTR